MDKLKVLLVDDEAAALDSLQTLVESSDKVEIIGAAKSVSEAHDLILEKKPDLVLLDIEMPGESGFDLLEKFEEINFDIVFTTAHDSYAIRAIKFSALDYLLKPIVKSELDAAIEKSIESGHQAQMEYYKNLLENLTSEDDDPTIVLREKDRTTVAKTSDIVRFESDRNYTMVYLSSGEKILLSKTLKVFDEMLEDQGFLRIHKSHLINTKHIDHVLSKELCVVMSNEDRVAFSLRKKKTLNYYLNNVG